MTVSASSHCDTGGADKGHAAVLCGHCRGALSWPHKTRNSKSCTNEKEYRKNTTSNKKKQRIPMIHRNAKNGKERQTGWWFEPLWQILVNWDDFSQYMGKQKMFQTTNQYLIQISGWFLFHLPLPLRARLQLTWWISKPMASLRRLETYMKWS